MTKNKFRIRNATTDASRPSKKAKIDLVPIVFIRLVNSKSARTLKTLCDSGAGGCLITENYVKGIPVRSQSDTSWNTMAGTFQTNGTASVTFRLEELNETAKINHKFHIAKSLGNYDAIIGRDLLSELGIIIDFKNSTLEWNDNNIPMRESSCTYTDSYAIDDPPGVDEMVSRVSGDNLKTILDAKYKKADLNKIINDNYTHLTGSQRRALLRLFQKYKQLFDGTLGTWKGIKHHIELREGATPYHGKAFPVPKAYDKPFRLEVDRLCQVGVLRKVNRSEWGAPTFVIPKKDQTIRFISDFRELNKRIKRKPFPIPKIQDLLLSLEGFKYATSLDLNMGFYHIELTPSSSALCTIVLPWGKYEYLKLPMGLCNSPDIFQEKVNELFYGLDYVKAYIDDLLIITKDSFEEHLNKVGKVLHKLNNAGLKINIGKSCFCKTELEYLGYWITQTGIRPLTKKVEAIHRIKAPTTRKALRSFIGIVNYYRNMWKGRASLLAPLTALTSVKSKWKWTEVEQKAFEEIKKVIAKETLLIYPNFNKRFDVHTDASDKQLGAVISQKGLPIAFYSRKLNPAQKNYTTTERELLAIVETLKEFKNILLGQRIRVYTDHKNLTYKTFNTERVIRWRMVIEDFAPELVYIQGEKNIVADGMSRLDSTASPTVKQIQIKELFAIANSLSTCKHITEEPYSNKIPSNNKLAECYSMDKLPDNVYPVHFKLIQREQQADLDLLRKAKENPKYSINTYHGGGKIRHLICKNNKIVIPNSLQKRLVEWYHTTLCHPGETRMELTISQHFQWDNMQKHIKEAVKKCHTCQSTKKKNTKYGLIPPKQTDYTPWDVLCVDLIGPYTIHRKGRHKNGQKKKDLVLWCVTMIDPTTNWFELTEVKTKRADVIANTVETTWLNRYPWPTQIILDRGTEFMAEFTEMVKNDYGITKKPITARNPQANGIIERIHQTLGNMVRTFQVQELELDEQDPWTGILGAVTFATRATIHSTLKATPSQLVFGRDAILNIQHEADWKLIKENRNKRILNNNKKENKNRKEHNYKSGDQVMLKLPTTTKYGTNAYSGPYDISKVHDNGTLSITKGAITDTYHIRNVKPYCS